MIDQLHLSSHHIVARHSEGTKFIVWNLPSLDSIDTDLIMSEQVSNGLFQIETNEEVEVMDPSFIFDELQILNISVKDILGTSPSSSVLTVSDFLKQ
jgi:hypothetical protein